MRVRLALAEDADAVLSLARMQVVETLPHLDFDRAIALENYQKSITTGDLALVAESGTEIVGYLFARMHGYAFAAGIFVSQEVVYVKPDKRGSRAAVSLLQEYIRWGEVVGAREILFGISNGQHADRAAKLFEHMGAERVGYHHRIVRPHGQERSV